MAFRGGWTRIEVIESESRPGIFYEIRRGKDGLWYCTCPAWAFSKDHVCRHLKASMAAGKLQAVNLAKPEDVIEPRAIKTEKVKKAAIITYRRKLD